jgi:hypothetical protein
MRRFDDDLRDRFIAWQCRIRQLSARDYGGQPLPAMCPRVSRKNGEILLPAMNTLLVPEHADASTAFFKFQTQKSPDPQQVREAVLKYLSGGFYQEPELFSDRLTAVFGVASGFASLAAKQKEVVLDYEQYSQSYRMFCKVAVLKEKDTTRNASLWQARIFNPAISNDATVLAFMPDWKSAVASSSI